MDSNLEKEKGREAIENPYEARGLVHTGVAVIALAAASVLFFASLPPQDEPTVEQVPPALAELEVEAKAAYVIDLRVGRVLYAKNEEAQLPLASVTKLMSAFIAAQALAPNETITIPAAAVALEGDSGFRVGERWRVQDLIDFSLLTSSNDGIYALAAAAVPGASFADTMNEAAAALGLEQTYFVNTTGLDANEALSGSYGSARDVALLLAHIIEQKPELLEATRYEALSFTDADGVAYSATNTNAVIGAIPGALASKTGFTDLAGGNLAVAFDAGLHHPIVAVVLSSSVEGRFADMQTIVMHVLDAFAAQAL